MKKLSLLIILVSLNIQVNAQEWDSIGTSLIYSQYSWTGSFVYPIKFESISRDSSTGYIEINEIHNETLIETHTVYAEEEQVYLYNQYQDTFNLLYDYSLIQGDTLYTRIGSYSYETELVYRIDSVYLTEIDGQFIKTQKISAIPELNTFNVVWGSNIIYEGIGNSTFYLPLGCCFDPWPGPLRCKITDMETIHFGDIPCDSVTIVNVFENNIDRQVTLFPNPFSNQITLEIENVELLQDKKTMLKIHDVNGREVFTTRKQIKESNLIELEYLEKGVYFVFLENSFGNIFIEKLVKM